MPMLAIGPFGLGPFELILILAIVVIIFGVGRLPEVGGAIGKGIREFRRSSKDDEPKQLNEAQSAATPETEPPPAPGAEPPVGRSPSTSVTCQKCGAPAAPGNRFCPACGAPLG